MIIIWQAVMIFKMSYRVFMLFTSIDPTQAPPFIHHLRGGSLLAGNDKKRRLPKARQTPLVLTTRHDLRWKTATHATEIIITYK